MTCARYFSLENPDHLKLYYGEKYLSHVRDHIHKQAVHLFRLKITGSSDIILRSCRIGLV